MADTEHSKGPTHVGGSAIQGPVGVQQGDFVGGNKTVINSQGMTVDDALAFFRGVQDTFSTSQLLNPVVLRQNLARLRGLHDELYEWKELHNHLDEIISALAPFSERVRALDKNPKEIDIQGLCNMWRRVASKVEALLFFAGQIQYIGKRFSEPPEGMKGDRWAVVTCTGCRSISQQLGLGGPEASRATPDIVKIDWSARMLGKKPGWWSGFYNQAEDFYTNTMQYMTEADKKLLERATDLYKLSQMIFGGANGEAEGSHPDENHPGAA